MKKFLFCLLLMTFQAIIPSEKNKFEKIALEPNTEPIVVGFKKFSEKELQKMSPEERELLHSIAHRSCIQSCFGLDSHTITTQERKKIENFKSDIHGKMNFEVIPIRRSSLIDSDDSLTPCDACMCHKPEGKSASNGLAGCMFGGIFGVMTAVGGGIAAFVAKNCIFLTLCVPGGAIPVCCCVSAEVCTCAYYRCCAEREIWNFDNPKK